MNLVLIRIRFRIGRLSLPGFALRGCYIYVITWDYLYLFAVFIFVFVFEEGIDLREVA